MRVPELQSGQVVVMDNASFHQSKRTQTLIEAAVEAHIENEHRILSDLDIAERKALAQLLRKLLTSFENH